MTQPITRAQVLTAIGGLAAWIVAPPASASAYEAAEQHVLTNANAALDALADRASTPAAREERFRAIITQMADVPRIAVFVLGRYGAQLRGDHALQARWIDAFEDHALTVYQDQLRRYAGSRVEVVSSAERVAGRDVIVRSQVRSRVSGRMLNLQWRLLRGEGCWRVNAVSFVADGNEIWLAQQQQREFAMVLDRHNGDIAALIASVRQTTANLRERTAAQ
jgi:ABC-type transporter MlaC component